MGPACATRAKTERAAKTRVAQTVKVRMAPRCLNAHRLCDVNKTKTLVKEAYSRQLSARRFQTATMNGAESVVQLGPSTSSRVLCRLLVSVQKRCCSSESIVFEIGVAIVHLEDLTLTGYLYSLYLLANLWR